MVITRKSPITGNVNSMDIDVSRAQLEAWKYGRILIQDAMPQLTRDECEFIKTGITPTEWNDYIGEEDTEE